jgi:Mg-chelatase subunit ChlI
VAFATDARPEGEALPTIELSYKRFNRFNRTSSSAAERIEEDAYVAQVPLLFDDFRRYALARYPELAALANAHHRKAELFKLWRSRQDALVLWCEARGRIATYAEFQTLHKERCARRKLRLHDAWADYTKAWDRIAGMALSVRRRTVTTEEAVVAPKATDKKEKAANDDEEEEAKPQKKQKRAAASSSSTTVSGDEKAGGSKKANKQKKAKTDEEEEDDAEEEDDDDECEMPRRVGQKA